MNGSRGGRRQPAAPGARVMDGTAEPSSDPSAVAVPPSQLTPGYRRIPRSDWDTRGQAFSRARTGRLTEADAQVISERLALAELEIRCLGQRIARVASHAHPDAGRPR